LDLRLWGKVLQFRIVTDNRLNRSSVQLANLVGREIDLQTLAGLWRIKRLVTITGCGGAGKTRLALEYATTFYAEFPDGVWWVDLGAVTESDAVAVTLAQIVGAQLDVSRPHSEAIAARVGKSVALLVLDNCEHLVEVSGRLIEELLWRCKNIRVLITSRVPLGVPGEVTWPIPTLSFPGISEGAQPDLLKDFQAVELFVDRAQHVRSTFTLTEANGPVVGEICRCLDGIPLAIELAAARTRSLQPSQILYGLTDSLHLSSGRSPAVAPRQQILEAAIEWSCRLLSDQQRRLLQRVCVFSGSFDLAGVEAVCSGDGLDQWDMLDLLERLVDHSLVLRLEGEYAGRYLLLETLRQFGFRNLERSESSLIWKTNHARYYASMAQLLAPLFGKAEHLSASKLLESEHDNLQAALGWFRSNGDAALSVQETLGFIDRSRRARGRPAIGWESLSSTEGHVAELVSDGMTNREISVRLLMSPETVKTHVSHIFAKLGLTKRAQLAALVAKRGNHQHI
jgi:predicted ATPase/DNA-binding CsgD family transcriptional regulator